MRVVTTITSSSRLLLVLLGLFCVLSLSLGDETATATEVTTTTTDFEVQDLLPGVAANVNSDRQDNTFVKNHILGNPEWYQKPFDPPDVVPKFNSLPRFSHSDDFSLLIGDNPDDYYLGLLFLGCFIVSFFVVWGIAIMVLKCIGPKYVGVLAGFPFRVEGKRSIAGRITLAVSAGMMIVSTIVLVTKGLSELQALSDTIGMTNNDIQMVEVEVQSIVTTLMDVSAKTVPIRDELVDFLTQDICPLEPGSDTEDQVRSLGIDTYYAMVDLDDFIEGYLNDVESGVNQTNKFTERVKGLVGRAQFNENPNVTAIVFPYFIVPAFLLVAVAMGWHDVFSKGFYKFITWVILPLIIVLTVGAIIAAGWMVISIEANSDLCSPTPEDTILNILNRLDLEADSGSGGGKLENGPSDNFFYDIMVFYTHQCTTPNPWQFMEGHYADLTRGQNILGEFLRSIEDTTLEQLSQECGHEYGPIVELLLQLQDLTTLLSKTSARALNLMSCRNIVPLYTTAVYEATCTQSPVAQAWVFLCTVSIAFFGCLCIMFRGAYYPIDYYYYDYDGDGEEKDDPRTDEDSGEGIEQVLDDTYSNDLVLKEEEAEQYIDTAASMEKYVDIDIYEDYGEQEKDDDDKEDEDDEDDEDDDDDNDNDNDYDDDNLDDEEDDEIHSTEQTEIGSVRGYDSSTKESSVKDEEVSC